MSKLALHLEASAPGDGLLPARRAIRYGTRATRSFLFVLLCAVAPLACTGEAEPPPPADTPGATPTQTPDPAPADTPSPPAAPDTSTPPPDAPAPPAPDIAAPPAPAPDPPAADTVPDPGPMIHPRRDPPGAEPGDSAGGLERDATLDPADTATWTIGVTSGSLGADVPPLAVLTSLRTGTHPDHVRMTVEVGPDATGPPGYKVEYIDRPLIECGSGVQIFPVGDAWLELRLEPAAAHTEDGRPTLGAREIAVEGPLLLRVYRTCNFEGVVTLVMALASPNPYRVLTLADPWRIVVDVRR